MKKETLEIKEYYKFYLSLHKNPWNRRLHFFGQLFTAFYILMCLYHALYWLLIFFPFVIYPFAWTGHFLFEKNSPLAWGGIRDRGVTTIKAKICDIIMFKDIITGKIRF